MLVVFIHEEEKNKPSFYILSTFKQTRSLEYKANTKHVIYVSLKRRYIVGGLRRAKVTAQPPAHIYLGMMIASEDAALCNVQVVNNSVKDTRIELIGKAVKEGVVRLGNPTTVILLQKKS